MITLIWAEDEKHGIAKNQKIPWHVKEDLTMFKLITTNKIVVMGFNTFTSIGSKPLPNRKNIILTKSHNTQCNELTTYSNLDALLKDFAHKDIYIIGGKQIYELFLKYADRLIVSTIPGDYNCDLFMDFIDWNQFKLVGSKQHQTFSVSIYEPIIKG